MINEQTAINKPRSMVTLVLAFAAIYIIWGSTYLAIKYAIETLPTFLMGGFRFTFAGIILFVIARSTSTYERPTAAQWKDSAIVGFFLLAVGNGGVVLAEHYISSALAALLVATVPFWMVLLSWIFMKTGRPKTAVLGGLLLGFLGVWMLISGRDSTGGGDKQWLGILLIIGAGAIGWSIGSLYGTRANVTRSPILTASMQMLTGGVVMIFIGSLLGEWSKFDLAAVSSRSWWAFTYLVLIGAVVAYTAYSWLMKNTSPSAISTYAYVNPAIAVLLGWLIAGESLNLQMLIGTGIIVASVALITFKKGRKEVDSSRVELQSDGTKEPEFST